MISGGRNQSAEANKRESEGGYEVEECEGVRKGQTRRGVGPPNICSA